MQNLPFLVTQSPLAQNSTLKNVVASQDNQKSSETNSSFKEVLSKQVENDAPKKVETKQSKTPQTKSSQNQAQASSKAPQAKSAEHKDEVETTEADQVDALDTSLLSDGLNPKAVKSDSKVEDTDEVLAAKLQNTTSQNAQLPISIAHIPFAANVKSDAPEGDSQKRLQLDANLRSALGQSTKSTLVVDNANVFSDKSSDSTTQSETGSDKKWLDSMLPNMHKSLENKDQLAGKLGAKLVSEAGIQLTENFSTKLKKEVINTLVPQTTAPVLAVADLSKVQSASSNYIQVPPGKAGWDQAISQKVVWMLGGAEQSATLTLNPPDLGPLQVVINVNNDKADTTFISENPEVRRALENGMPALRGLLDQAGVQLGQANVSTSQQQQEFQQSAKGRSTSSLNTDNTAKTTDASITSSPILRVNNGLVDTFA